MSGELAHARRLAALGDDYWAGQVARLEGRIAALRGQ